MGGMIAQTLAARRPERVLSLTSIMSSTGARWRGQPALRRHCRSCAPVSDRRARTYVERTARAVRHHRLARLRARPTSDLRARPAGLTTAATTPAGTARQLAAILASGDRTAALRRIAAPTARHPRHADHLVAPSGGRATARAIPGARLAMIEGMGHDLPRGRLAPLIDAIVENARRARPGDAAAAA